MTGPLAPIAHAPRDGLPILLYAPDPCGGPDGLFGVGLWVPRRLFGRRGDWDWQYDVRPTHWCRLPPNPPRGTRKENSPC